MYFTGSLGDGSPYGPQGPGGLRPGAFWRLIPSHLSGFSDYSSCILIIEKEMVHLMVHKGSGLVRLVD